MTLQGDATMPASPPSPPAQRVKKKTVWWKENLLDDEPVIARDHRRDDEGSLSALASTSGTRSSPRSSTSSSSAVTHASTSARSRPSSASSTTSSDASTLSAPVNVGAQPPTHLGIPLVTWSTGSTPIPRLRFRPVDFLITQRQAAKLPMHPSLKGGQTLLATELPSELLYSSSSALATASSPSPTPSSSADGGAEASIPINVKLTYKIVGGCECHILRSTLVAHGWREAGPTQNDFNLLWSSGKVEPHEFRLLNRYQKVNRFPRTVEMTRKEKLYLNISRMRQTFGDRHFDFIPPTFLLPQEYEAFYMNYLRIGGRWIVKPIGSHAREVQIICSLAELPSRLNIDDKFLIQKFIENPLLINGRSFEVRIYVTVTSFSPLRIYMFEEGITRFAKEGNSDDASAPPPPDRTYGGDQQEDTWSLSALIRYLTCKFSADTASMIMAKIKSFLSGEAVVSSAVNMFVQHSGNCFEFLGFDFVIDQNMTPWLLEINLTPSLACDTALDLNIKAKLVADMLTLVGIIPFEKISRRGQVLSQPKPYRAPHGAVLSGSASKADPSGNQLHPQTLDLQKLTPEQQKLVRLTRDEGLRCGSFCRVFPTDSSAYLYSSFIPKNSINWILLIALFGRTSLARPRKDIGGGGLITSHSRSGSSSLSSMNASVPRFNSLAYLLGDSEPSSSRRSSTSTASTAPGSQTVGITSAVTSKANKESASSAPWAIVDQVELAMAAEQNGNNIGNSVSQHIKTLEIQLQRQNGSRDSASPTVSASISSNTTTVTVVSPTATATAVTTVPAAAASGSRSSQTAPAAEILSVGQDPRLNSLLGNNSGTTSAAKSGRLSSKRLAEKIQAREAFHVFLENILLRLRKHYEQSDPTSESDMSYVRQQVAVVDKFLMQAKELSVDNESQQPPIIDTNNIEDLPALTDRLEKFIKSYKKQTERFKTDCLASGKISGTSAFWTTQNSSASSSRTSSRPSSASNSGRTSLMSQHPSYHHGQFTSSSSSTPSICSTDDGNDDDSQASQTSSRRSIVIPQRFPMRHIGTAAASSRERAWANPVLANKASSAFPVSYGWTTPSSAGKPKGRSVISGRIGPVGSGVGSRLSVATGSASRRNSVSKGTTDQNASLTIQGARYSY